MSNCVHAFSSSFEDGHSVYTHENRGCKDETAFAKTIEVFKEAKSVVFNSMISNEEAMILQKLKERHGYRLVNKDARKFQTFLKKFAMAGGKHLYGADLHTVESSDVVVVLGSLVRSDSPELARSLKKAFEQKSHIIYMHPLEDDALEPIIAQYVKYEVGSEEGLIAMLADSLVSEEGRQRNQAFFNELDIGYICGESSVGEEEFDAIAQAFSSAKRSVLVAGADLYNHPRSENIAKILGLISKYSKSELLMIPSEANTLGVALICDLDDTVDGKTVGYNVQGDYTLSFLGNGDLDMPGIRQQEGTLTSLDKRVVSFTAEDGFDGYRLNDIANALGVKAEDTTDYTAKLPAMSGYKAVAFNDLKKSDVTPEAVCGYELENADVQHEDGIVDEIDEISEFNGTVIYRCNHPLSLSEQTKKRLTLVGSNQFAAAAKIKTGAMVRFEMDGKTYERQFKVSEDLKGTIACNPVFDSTDNYDEYRYKRVKLEEVDE